MEMPFFQNKSTRKPTNQVVSLDSPSELRRFDGFFDARGFEGGKNLGVFFFGFLEEKTQGETRGGKFGKLLCPQVFFGKVPPWQEKKSSNFRAVRAVKTQTFAIVKVEESSWSFVIDKTCRKVFFLHRCS